MSVPEDDILCRFVREKDWSAKENRPRPSAFRETGLSLWHVGRLLEHNVQVEDLRLKHLEGVGQAHHTAGQYIKFALEVAQETNKPFPVSVEWRPEDEHVTEPWRKWRYAHVQVEVADESKNFDTLFRQKLAQNARKLVPPDKFLNPDSQNLS